MTSETLSIPIAPATGCCSESEAKADGLPILSVGQLNNAEACCNSASTESPAVMASQQECCSSGQALATDPVVSDENNAPDDATLIDALRTVIDPELMINIVDLGLVYSINQTDRKVLVEMTLTSPACPAGPQIISQAKMALEKISGIDTAEIKLTMSPPWTPDRMTDDARDQLGIF
ncbi:MAG: metal-sulfur cluster assembly factor [Schlesneria sp.]